MQYRTMPSGDDRLSALGFGAMRLPLAAKRIDEERATRLVREAIEAGVNYIDTAMPYHNGESESFLGRALADGYREKVYLATKLPPWSVEAREDMDRLLVTQLAKLRTDHIDYYLLHSLTRRSWERMRDLGVIEFLETAKEKGRIRHIGFSFHDNPEAFREVVDAYAWDFCQIQYNILDECHQAGTAGLEYAAARGLGVIIMEPLRGGHLARAVPDEVRAIEAETGVSRTPAEWALRWIWNRPEVTVVLSGMSDEAQLRENIRTAEDALPGSLSQGDLAMMARVRDIYRDRMMVDCTGCGYCMPCPYGVDIPGCFAHYNNYGLFGKEPAVRYYFAQMTGIMDKEGYAGLCRGCGKCVRACPQHLPIPDLLQDVSRTFEGPAFTVLRPAMKHLKGIHRHWTNLKNRRYAASGGEES
ncbi:aldo/keto reductase [Methanovulcanius yangii]|uniref:aldo/keto reductase n=1 Tax=Methanovulcanius yangii TaxID=1789227 RepID=UPI0029CA70ED|nr:aldo/keto reductase [Methanovulcanius yangii]